MLNFLKIINKISLLFSILLIIWNFYLLIKFLFFQHDGFLGLVLIKFLLFFICIFFIFLFSSYFLYKQKIDKLIKKFFSYLLKHNFFKYFFWTLFLGYFLFAIIVTIFNL